MALHLLPSREPRSVPASRCTRHRMMSTLATEAGEGSSCCGVRRLLTAEATRAWSDYEAAPLIGDASVMAHGSWLPLSCLLREAAEPPGTCSQ
jgi:hypothetical protein